MAPQRPRRRLIDLPYLFLIGVFQKLEPKDQVSASRANSRCASLVRAANRRVRTLIISSSYNFEIVKSFINSFSLVSEPVMQQLPDVNEPLVGDYPMTTRVSKWNCLDVRDLPTTDELVYIFSAVTDLKFVTSKFSAFNKTEILYLVDLLRHSSWTSQLTSFMLNSRMIDLPENVVNRLFTAINGLSSLEDLAISLLVKVPVPDMTILSKLKVIAVKPYSNLTEPFLRSLERHAAANEQLQVHLLTNYISETDLRSLSEPLCSHILRFSEQSFAYIEDNVPLLCSRFTSLTTLSIWDYEASHFGPLFAALSQLPHLVRLGLKVNFEKNGSFEELPWSSRPQTQLKSVRALNLNLVITSHFQVQWLNLQWTLPHLQAIHLKWFECQSCSVNFWHVPCEEGVNSASFPPVRKCLQEAVLPHLHLGVHPERIIFQLGLDFSFHFISFAQL